MKLISTRILNEKFQPMTWMTPKFSVSAAGSMQLSSVTPDFPISVRSGKLTTWRWKSIQSTWNSSDPKSWFPTPFALARIYPTFRGNIPVVLVEIKCINVRRNTTVFSNCWRNQLHVSALLWVGHHQVETRISEKTHILQCGHQEWGTRSRFTMFLDVHIVVYEFSPIF
jgi:hypothetical protein